MFDDKYLSWNQRRIKCIIDFYNHKFIYNKKILDLGCGHADISGALYRLGGNITAVDARQEHLQTASKKFNGIKTIKADLDIGWPFLHQKFDIILNLALLCHLRDYKTHLKNVCASTTHLVLETAVCDSDDPEKCVIFEENKGVYDNSINGVGCRPTTANIEKILSECGMSFKRMDNARLNSTPFIYDWVPSNNNDISINKRRLWFAVKTTEMNQLAHISPPTFQLSGGSSRNTNTLHNSQVAIEPKPRVMVTGILDVLTPVEPSATNPPTYTPNISNTTSNIDDVEKISRKFAISPENSLSRHPNLRIFYVPLGDQKGMCDAWNNIGVQLKVFDFYTAWLNNNKNTQLINDQFLEIVRDFKPHLIHMQLQITGIITPETISQAKQLSPGVIITNWSGDIRTHVIHEMNVMSRVVDYTLISSTGQLDLYKRAGVTNAKYWQVGYDPKFNYPKYYPNSLYDISFIANNYGNNFPDGHLRVNAVLKCQATFGTRFGLFGSGWPNNPRSCDPKEGNEIYNKSICALSISNFNNVSHYFSDRLLYCIASGRPTISWYFPGCESYFKEGKEIFYAKNNEDIVNIVNYCKSNPEAANMIGVAGAERAQAEHTFTSKILELLYIIGLDND